MKLLFLIIGIGMVPFFLIAAQDQQLPPSPQLLDATNDQWTIKNSKGDIDHPKVFSRIKVASKKSAVQLFEYIAEDFSIYSGAKVISLTKYPRPLLFTDWIRGNNTLCVRIFDPSLGTSAKLKEECSKDLQYTINEDHVDILQFQFKDSDDSTLIELKTEWRPSEIPKAAPADNP